MEPILQPFTNELERIYVLDSIDQSFKTQLFAMRTPLDNTTLPSKITLLSIRTFAPISMSPRISIVLGLLIFVPLINNLWTLKKFRILKFKVLKILLIAVFNARFILKVNH